MATSAPLIGITGSTGQLGSRVASRLAALGHHQRLLVRNPARAPHLPGVQIVQASYEEGASMRAALEGVQALFLVSGYGSGRLEQHGSAIDAAVAAGVERIVYTSFLAAAPRRLSRMPASTSSPSNTSAPAADGIPSSVRASTWIRPLAGSPVKASSADPRATAPPRGSLATTWLMWRWLY